MPTPALIAWSGGKDSAMALWRLSPEYQPVALLTNVQRSHDRVSAHGVRRALIEQQAAALRLPLRVVELSDAPTNTEYEAQIEAGVAPFRARGIVHIVYGDLFLADIRAFIGDGFRAVVVCVDTTQLSIYP